MMNQQEKDTQILKGLLDEFLQTHYNGSFAQMVCEYIRATGMTKEEVDALLEEMKHPSV
jgi:predicted transcriptional regulator